MAAIEVTLNVDELKGILSDYHNNDCWAKTKNWFNGFGNNAKERSRFLKQVFYTPSPLTPTSVSQKVDDFSMLQADIIQTKAAITNNPIFDYNSTEYSIYVVVPTSCSVQPGRYRFVLLARLWPLEEINEGNQNAYLSSLLFKNGKLFYFPPINGIIEGKFGFLAVFEEISYIENGQLQSCKRLASLSELGWHLFNAFLVNHYTRPSSDDIKLRKMRIPKEWKFANDQT